MGVNPELANSRQCVMKLEQFDEQTFISLSPAIASSANEIERSGFECFGLWQVINQ